MPLGWTYTIRCTIAVIGKSNVENAGVGCLNVNFDKLNKGDVMVTLDAVDILRSTSEKAMSAQRTEAKISDSISLDDALAFAEYFHNNFNYYDNTADGDTYKCIVLSKIHLPAMTIKQAFDQWKSRNV